MRAVVVQNDSKIHVQWDGKIKCSRKGSLLLKGKINGICPTPPQNVKAFGSVQNLRKIPVPKLIQGKMLATVVFSLVLQTFSITADNSQDSAHTIVFERKGRIALQTSFAHIAVDLHLPELLDNYRQLEKMINLTYHHTMKVSDGNFGNNLAEEKNRLDLTMERLMVMINLATGGEELIEWKKIKAQDTHAWETELLDAFNTTTKTDDRNRRNAAVGVTALAGFGLSLYNSYQITKIGQSIGAVQQEVDIITHQLVQTDLKMNEAIQMLNRQKRAITLLAKHIQDTGDRESMQALRADVIVAEQLFIHELDDYVSGLTQLVHHKFSPLLVKVSALHNAHKTIVETAQKQNLKPITDNYQILFQAKTSTVLRDGRLTAIIHVPLYSQSLYELYRYIQAPFVVDHMMIEPKVEKIYLAMDVQQTLARELSTEELEDCLKINEIWHCSHQNIIERKMKNLCLYNLFKDSIEDIRRTCNLQIRRKGEHAVQIGAGTFRYITPEDVTLSRFCGRHISEEVIRDVNVIELNSTCNRAMTTNFVFTFNPELEQKLDLVPRRLTIVSREWLTDLNRTWAVDSAQVLQELQGEEIKPIDLQTFQRQMEEARQNYVSLSRRIAFEVITTLLFLAVVCYALYRTGVLARVSSCLRKGSRGSHGGDVRTEAEMEPLRGGSVRFDPRTSRVIVRSEVDQGEDALESLATDPAYEPEPRLRSSSISVPLPFHKTSLFTK